MQGPARHVSPLARDRQILARFGIDGRQDSQSEDMERPRGVNRRFFTDSLPKASMPVQNLRRYVSPTFRTHGEGGAPLPLDPGLTTTWDASRRSNVARRTRRAPERSGTEGRALSSLPRRPSATRATRGGAGPLVGRPWPLPVPRPRSGAEQPATQRRHGGTATASAGLRGGGTAPRRSAGSEHMPRPPRVRVLRALAGRALVCACEIAQCLGGSTSARRR
jgi:hypothetical protein